MTLILPADMQLKGCPLPTPDTVVVDFQHRSRLPIYTSFAAELAGIHNGIYASESTKLQDRQSLPTLPLHLPQLKRVG